MAEQEPTHSFRCTDTLWDDFGTYCQSIASSRTQEMKDFMTSCVMKYKMDQGIVPKQIQKSIDQAVATKIEDAAMEMLKELLSAMQIKTKQDMLLNGEFDADSIFGEGE